MRFASLTFFLCSLFTAQAQTFETPYEYISFFNKEFAQLQDMQLEYFAVRTHLGTDIAEQQSADLFKRTQSLHQRIKKSTAYTDDQNIRTNALKTTNLLLAIGAKDYHQAAIQQTQCDDCFPTALLETQLLNQDSDQLSAFMEELIQSMHTFAEQHGITFTTEGNPRDIVLNKITRINNYLQDVNLAVLEVQYADAAVVDALNAGDLAQVKKQVQTLLEASTNATNRLKNAPRIKEDVTVIYQANQLIICYRKAAQYVYPNMLASYDADGKMINEKVESYNKSIDVLDKNVQALTQKYLEVRSHLERHHIPKPQTTSRG